MTIETLLATDKISEEDLREMEKLTDDQLRVYFAPYLALTRVPEGSKDELVEKAREKKERKEIREGNKKLSLLEQAQRLAAQHGATFSVEDIKSLPSKL